MEKIVSHLACEAENIFKDPDPCSFVRNNCEDPEKSSQYYYELYFCIFNQSNYAFAFVTVLFFLTAFYLLSSTAEIYLSPALSKLSKKFNLSETLAGVTLVAFANGAPDVISSFSAGESLEGIPLIIGSIFGGGMFILTIIVAFVIFASKNIRAEKNGFLRDIGFYILATLYVMMLGAIGSVNLYSIAGFMFLFPCYIVIVFITERKQNKNLSSHLLEELDTNLSYKTMKDEEERKPKIGIELNAQFLNENHASGPKKESLLEAMESTEKDNKSLDATMISSDGNLETRHNLLNEMGKEERRRFFGCLSAMDKVIRSLQAPFHLMRSLTIPASDEELWSKPFAIIQPFTSVYFFLLVTGNFFETFHGFWIGLYILPIQIALSFIIWKFASDSLPRFEFILILGGLVLSITWIYQVAVLTVEYLEFIGFITQIHPTLLGMSLLAWGNSMQDLFGNRSLAKLGYGLMALTGCFAGSLFNLLIGFGSSMFRQVWNAKDHSVPFEIFNFSNNEGWKQESFLSMGVLAFSFLNLIVTLTYSILNKYKFTRGYAVYLMLFYGLAILLATIHALQLKTNHST